MNSQQPAGENQNEADARRPQTHETGGESPSSSGLRPAGGTAGEQVLAAAGIRLLLFDLAALLAREMRQRIKTGEGRRLEFKRGLPTRAKVARTLASFANGAGGLLLVGIEDDRGVCGAPHPEATLRELAEVAQHEVEPPLAPWTWIQAFEGQRLVAAFVPRSRRAPHRARTNDGQLEAVIRRAASTCEVDENELARALAERDRLDADELCVLAWLARSTARGAARRTTAARVARATGLARSRVRRALQKLEHGGWLFGVGAGAGERFHLAPPVDELEA